VWQLPETRLCDYTVCCKSCGENIPAPVMTMPEPGLLPTVLCAEIAEPTCHPTSSEAACHTFSQ
jgi:hypothetical protein